MFSPFSEFIDAMIDGVEFSGSWISDSFSSSSRCVQFWDSHGVVVTDGKNGIEIQRLAVVAKQAREADQRQMSISGQYQYHSGAAQSQQYSMSVQPQYIRGTFMQQQPQQYGMSAQTQQSHDAYMQQPPQNSQGVTMSVPRPGNAPHWMNHFVPQQSYGQQ